MILRFTTQNQSHLITQTVEILKSGGLIVYPTDTIYGVGCDALDKNAVDKIYKIKERDDRKPMSFICSDINQIQKLANLNSAQLEILNKNLPGPFTFILPASQTCQKHLKSENNTVGIRMPDHELCLKLVEKLSSPIITTSINKSNQPPLNDPQKINEIFRDQLDLILDAGKINSVASTIVDLTQGEPNIIREGNKKLKL